MHLLAQFLSAPFLGLVFHYPLCWLSDHKCGQGNILQRGHLLLYNRIPICCIYRLWNSSAKTKKEVYFRRIPKLVTITFFKVVLWVKTLWQKLLHTWVNEHGFMLPSFGSLFEQVFKVQNSPENLCRLGLYQYFANHLNGWSKQPWQHIPSNSLISKLISTNTRAPQCANFILVVTTKTKLLS